MPVVRVQRGGVRVEEDRAEQPGQQDGQWHPRLRRLGVRHGQGERPREHQPAERHREHARGQPGEEDLAQTSPPARQRLRVRRRVRPAHGEGEGRHEGEQCRGAGRPGHPRHGLRLVEQVVHQRAHVRVSGSPCVLPPCDRDGVGGPARPGLHPLRLSAVQLGAGLRGVEGCFDRGPGSGAAQGLIGEAEVLKHRRDRRRGGVRHGQPAQAVHRARDARDDEEVARSDDQGP